VTSKTRQTLLLAVLGAILLYYAGEWLFETVLEAPRRARSERAQQLTKRIEQREKDLARVLKAVKQLETYEAQSLPSNTEIAVSFYRSWLTELVEYAKLSNAYVDAGAPLNRRGIYQSVDFSIRASGTLQQLLTFLFEFYQAGHLHQIQRISITPVPRSGQLELDIAVQALVLPTADRADRLSTVGAKRLASDRVADYNVLVDRNLFGFTDQGVHQTDQTYLTAVVQVNESPQAWFTVRSTDEVRRLSVGEQLTVGTFQGTIAAITDHDVVVSSDGERWLLTVGENLAQALALPPEY
jgi:hypothetical protein